MKKLLSRGALGRSFYIIKKKGRSFYEDGAAIDGEMVDSPITMLQSNLVVHQDASAEIAEH